MGFCFGVVNPTKIGVLDVLQRWRDDLLGDNGGVVGLEGRYSYIVCSPTSVPLRRWQSLPQLMDRARKRSLRSPAGGATL